MHLKPTLADCQEWIGILLRINTYTIQFNTHNTACGKLCHFKRRNRTYSITILFNQIHSTLSSERTHLVEQGSTAPKSYLKRYWKNEENKLNFLIFATIKIHFLRNFIYFMYVKLSRIWLDIVRVFLKRMSCLPVVSFVFSRNMFFM